MPVDVQTWRVRTGMYNAGSLSAIRTRYGPSKSVKGSDVPCGCGAFLAGLSIVGLLLLCDLLHGRVGVSKLYCVFRVHCGSSKGVVSMKVVNASYGAAVVLFILALSLSLLLLQAGDVERNPGPDGVILTPEDLPVLVRKLKDIAGKWSPLGVQLNFTPGTLDGFPATTLADPIKALQELLTRWLQRTDPLPTLEALAKAVGGPVIENELLARNLLEQHSDFPSIHEGQTGDCAGMSVSSHTHTRLSNDMSSFSTSTDSMASPTESAFWCPCGECSLNSFLLNGVCSSRHRGSFPYLNTSQLDDDDRSDLEAKLTMDTEVMIKKFGGLVVKTLLSLEKQGVSHTIVRVCVIHLEGFVQDHEKEFEQAGSVEDIFVILHHCWSFLNYDVLEEIIIQLGTEDDKKHLDKYLCDLETFCKRSAFAVPDHVYGGKNPKKPMFAVKMKMPQNTIKDVLQAKRKIAKILDVRPSTLHICCVEEGCVKVHFIVPEYIAKEVLPPSPERLAALAEESIQFLEYDGKQYICQERKVDSATTTATVTSRPLPLVPSQRSQKPQTLTLSSDDDQSETAIIKALGRYMKPYHTAAVASLTYDQTPNMSSGDPATKEFRLFLLSVANKLKGEESDTLCWLNDLPVQLKGTSPLTVLQEMEALDLFSVSKPERLAKILKDINRIDLAKKVTDYVKTRSSKRKKKVIAQSEDHHTTLIANLKVALIHTEITIAQLERVQETLMLEAHQSICQIREVEELIRDAKGDAESIQRRLEEATRLVPPPKPQQSQSLPVSSNEDVVYDQPEAGIGAQWNVLANTEHHYSPAPLTVSSEVPKSQLVTVKSANPPAPLPKPKDRTPPSPQLQTPPPSRIPKPRTQSPIPTRKESAVHELDYANYPQSSDFSGGSDYSGTGDSGFAEATSFLRRPLSKPHNENEPEAIAYYKSLDREAVDDIIYDQPTKNS